MAHLHRLRKLSSALALTACVVALAAPPAALAAPASEPSVRELLAVTQTESLLTQSYTQVEGLIRQSVAQSVAGRTLTDEQKRMVEAAPARLAAVMREAMTWTKLEPIYVGIYRENFDQEEVDGLIAFYKSPVGRSFVSKMPAVMQRSLSVTMVQLKDLMPKLQAEMEQILKDAKVAPKI
ncbi:MAG: DUF2059 domain-containing protein [Rubrivivax sp.]